MQNPVSPNHSTPWSFHSPNYSPHSPEYSPGSPAYSPRSPEPTPSPFLRPATPNSRPGEESWETFAKRLSPRLRPLTPRGFQEVDIKDAPYALFQERATFFKLPPNIRVDILRLAFGDRRLHIDLSYDCPDLSKPGKHYNVQNEGLGFRFNARRDRDLGQLPAWRWWSSVCHRIAPGARAEPMTRGGLEGPWADNCREGHAIHCNAWRDIEGPSACQVGVMGWLLACRQSYAEGMHVLYSTNTFVMRDEHMITHLPRLLLPQRLAAITALEISWPLRTGPDLNATDQGDLDIYREERYELEADHLEILFELLSSRFPALHHLHVSLERSDLYEPSFRDLPRHGVAIQKLLDGFAKRMHSLKECAFAVPDMIFDHIYDEAASEPMDHGSICIHTSYRQVWREVDGKTGIVRLPFRDSYPAPPHWSARGSARVPGYWILEGTNKPPFTPFSCGTGDYGIFDTIAYSPYPPSDDYHS